MSPTPAFGGMLDDSSIASVWFCVFVAFLCLCLTEEHSFCGTRELSLRVGGFSLIYLLSLDSIKVFSIAYSADQLFYLLETVFLFPLTTPPRSALDLPEPPSICRLSQLIKRLFSESLEGSKLVIAFRVY